MVYIYNGDIKFKRQLGGDMDIYPYGPQAKERSWYVGEVKTDAEGKFTFNIRSTSANDICFNGGGSETGKRYMMVCVEKSLDIAHLPSNSHLRVVGFKTGSTQVLYNDIYDLSKGSMKRLWLDGKTEEIPFTEVKLVMQNPQPHILGSAD